MSRNTLLNQKIVSKSISELKLSEYNPRKISDLKFKELCKGIAKFKMVLPIVINSNVKRRDYVIGGHQRIRAHETLGLKFIPCIQVDLNEEDEKELRGNSRITVAPWLLSRPSARTAVTLKVIWPICFRSGAS